jgi:hypothetical protein
MATRSTITSSSQTSAITFGVFELISYGLMALVGYLIWLQLKGWFSGNSGAASSPADVANHEVGQDEGVPDVEQPSNDPLSFDQAGGEDPA